MTISECIRSIKDEGYQNGNIFIRLTGRSDNTTLCVGTKTNNMFHYSFQKYKSQKEAMKEIKRLIKIYVVTEQRGRSVHKCMHTYYKQYIN